MTITVENVQYKLFQIFFSRRDGTVFVSFPYFADTEGIVSIGTLHPGSTDIDLEPQGKMTSHLVKYSHHPDGRVHFSQDGRVYTEIKRRAAPLDEAYGQLFNVKIQGVEAFDQLEDDSGKKRATINFSFPQGERPQSVNFDVFLQHETELIAHARDAKGPEIMADVLGEKRPAFLVGPPSALRGGYRVLLVTAQPIPKLDHDSETALVFMAGFDAAGRVGVDQPFECLIASYPADDPEGLLGTIDLPEGFRVAGG